VADCSYDENEYLRMCIIVLDIRGAR
jgi:hypothetical protein